MDQELDFSRASQMSAPLRALLHDAAVCARVASSGTCAVSSPRLHEHCMTLTARLQQALLVSHHPDDVRGEVLFMQAILLDHARATEHVDDKRGPLSTSFTSDLRPGSAADALLYFVSRFDARLNHPHLEIDLLSCYTLVAALLLSNHRNGEVVRAPAPQRGVSRVLPSQRIRNAQTRCPIARGQERSPKGRLSEAIRQHTGELDRLQRDAVCKISEGIAATTTFPNGRSREARAPVTCRLATAWYAIRPWWPAFASLNLAMLAIAMSLHAVAERIACVILMH